MDYSKAERERLRREMKARRAALTFEEIEHDSAAAAARVLSLPLFQTQQCVASFVNFGKEISTYSLNIELKRRGHILGLPVVSISEKGLMRFYSFKDGAAFVPNRFHIMEPPALPERELKPECFSAVLLPLTAFDKSGNRLGMGGGYYDRFLKKLSPACRLIGLAFDFQEVEHIPAENWDMPVHEVVTPTRHLVLTP